MIGQMVVFEADYDKIKLQNIVMTSSPLCHRKTSPKERHKNFSNLGPSQSKFLAAPVVLG